MHNLTELPLSLTCFAPPPRTGLTDTDDAEADADADTEANAEAYADTVAITVSDAAAPVPPPSGAMPVGFTTGPAAPLLVQTRVVRPGALEPFSTVRTADPVAYHPSHPSAMGARGAEGDGFGVGICGAGGVGGVGGVGGLGGVGGARVSSDAHSQGSAETANCEDLVTASRLGDCNLVLELLRRSADVASTDARGPFESIPHCLPVWINPPLPSYTPPAHKGLLPARFRSHTARPRTACNDGREGTRTRLKPPPPPLVSLAITSDRGVRRDAGQPGRAGVIHLDHNAHRTCGAVAPPSLLSPM